MSQGVARLSMRQESNNENGPGDRGHSSKVLRQPWGVRVKPRRRKCLIFGVLQPEIGQVSIARRDAGGGCEQAVDRGHQAAEIPVDGAKVAVTVLDIWVPFLKRGGAPRCVLGTI
jgi:hypothetical protein